MRILVIGGTGFVGSPIVRQLVDQGHTVAVFHRRTKNAALPAGVREFLNPDHSWPIKVFPKDLLSFEPEAVVHTFAMGEADADALIRAFRGRTSRLIVLSSGDVYRAYGCFMGFEPGPTETGLLSENSPVRSALYPYRKLAANEHAMEYWYEKILVEKAVLSVPDLLVTVLRLPKVYGEGNNADLGTIYSNRHQPQWRWTHGHVENVAAAAVLATTSPQAAGRIYNVGEERTPTIAERLAFMPPSPIGAIVNQSFNYAQDLAYDTSRIRQELGFRETIPEREATLLTLERK